MKGTDYIALVMNAGEDREEVTINWWGPDAEDQLTGVRFLAKDGKLTIEIPPFTGYLLS